MRNTVAFVLGGGRGTRLYPLTKFRSKPAAPLAGKYRLIDIPLSNCLNSGLNRIYVLTQFMSVSLHRHIRQTYRFDHFGEGFVELLAAQQTMDDGTDWYQGTADAVRKNLRYFDQPHVENVLILSGDQLYRMDYREMLQTHQQAGADVTIAALPVSRDDAKRFGVMRIDASGQVTGFLEKPKTEEELEMVRMDPDWGRKQNLAVSDGDCLGSMGIYLFKRQTLVDVLNKTPYEDFGKEVFPASIRTRKVQAHLFNDYWEDIGTIRAFYDANLNLTGAEPAFHLFKPDAPVYTRPRFLPPSLLLGAEVRNSMIAEGCRIEPGAVVENSIIGLRCKIGAGCQIRNSIIMGSDFYDDRCEEGVPPIGIGSESQIEGAIVDKNCRIGRRVRIVNTAGLDEADPDERVAIRDGIPVVVKDSVFPDGWVLEAR